MVYNSDYDAVNRRDLNFEPGVRFWQLKQALGGQILRRLLDTRWQALQVRLDYHSRFHWGYQVGAHLQHHTNLAQSLPSARLHAKV